MSDAATCIQKCLNKFWSRVKFEEFGTIFLSVLRAAAPESGTE